MGALGLGAGPKLDEVSRSVTLLQRVSTQGHATGEEEAEPGTRTRLKTHHAHTFLAKEEHIIKTPETIFLTVARDSFRNRKRVTHLLLQRPRIFCS
ncbi:hypothetical protein EYF80_043914 [Liparis tanakae]|uniref:Uncharacterized protein n=1 Tax=Liparis tanakae TaxID=230148 RepID=A0A4Z2G010_9TELE|nr:hypothetical protein EYF80_043914 [Liparis tanakae]